ncbi:MAG TPA: squalene--hopene cyclase [Methylomirabilota bacterium]|jgi:squalene-hopene/tetraprenyl-beta-curcumene cyclase|nr:squalene--hopene cyclase [Methylomirabilota bacterium]
MLPSAIVTGLPEAISRAQAHLLSRQADDGAWVGELEADTTITSEYLLLGHLIDRVNRERELKAVRYLRSRQLPDGGFNLFEGGPTNLSATIKAYFAMKMAGVAVDDPAMVRARQRIRAMGGPARANVFTKIQLALFGEYDWNGVPAMPVEIMLLPPPFFLFNIYEVSYWSRTVIVPLLIIMDRKPVKWLPPHLSLDELWPVPREQTSLRFSRVPEPFSWRALFWKSFFIAVDDGLKIWERFSPRPLRKRAVEAARLWLEERLAVPGGLGGIYPAMAYAVLALRLLGYPDDHPLIRGQLKEIEALAREDADEIHYQPCVSPVWDTALAINALVESDLEPDHPALRRAGEWLLDRQVLVPGDWQVRRPYVQPGGWVFQYANDYYPDLDDTAIVLMALEKLRGLDPDRVRTAQERGLGWLLGMQATDGGWASFDTDQKRLYLNNIPFADHGALLDPSTEDLTGRGLELLGTCGYRPDFEPSRRALQFLRHTQRHDGPWFGRWGVNYIYGTWSVLRGLRAIGEDLRQEYVQRAVRWLERHQNPDGGWGETCESYDRPELAGKGDSIPSQTAWALLGLLAAGSTNRRVIDAGIGYLLRSQREDGSWEDSLWNGTGFPRVFMLKYHLYAAYFPLWALGVYRRTFDG